MNTYKPINCGHYDILEVICMDSYEVDVFTQAGKQTGIAKDLEKREGGEFLLLESADESITAIRADQINKIDVLTRPCRFHSHEFR